MSDINKIIMRPGITKAIERRAFHTWATAMYVTFILGSCILIGSAWISNSLDSYCPEDTGVVFRLT